MARKHCIAAITTLLSIVGLAAAGLGGVYVALGQEQPFYTAALAVDPLRLAAGSRELESRASALYSESRQPGGWKAAFTEEQINGWLAVQLANSFRDALPANLIEPRISIGEDSIALAFRTRRGGVDTVVTARAAIMLTDGGRLAVRLESVHAGALPLPAMQVAEDISRACRELELPVSWTQDNGQPVAIVDVSGSTGTSGKTISLAALELRSGTIYVEGETIETAVDAGR